MAIGDEWKVVAGVRYDRYNASLTNSINLPPSASQGIGFTSARAGVIWQPTDTQSYYLSYGTSFNRRSRRLRSSMASNRSIPRPAASMSWARSGMRSRAICH
jgi:outer membrane receptor protein involved in Fe transport